MVKEVTVGDYRWRLSAGVCTKKLLNTVGAESEVVEEVPHEVMKAFTKAQSPQISTS